MKPTPAQVEKLMLDNPQLNIFDLAQFLGMNANKTQRMRDRFISNQAKRKTDIFSNLKFKGGKLI